MPAWKFLNHCQSEHSFEDHGAARSYAYRPACVTFQEGLRHICLISLSLQDKTRTPMNVIG